jgi:hypothetical protein
VVPPDSHGISRAPCYLGYFSGVRIVSSTGVAPSVPGLSMPFDYNAHFLLHASVSALTEKSHDPPAATPDRYHTTEV